MKQQPRMWWCVGRVGAWFRNHHPIQSSNTVSTMSALSFLFYFPFISLAICWYFKCRCLKELKIWIHESGWVLVCVIVKRSAFFRTTEKCFLFFCLLVFFFTMHLNEWHFVVVLDICCHHDQRHCCWRWITRLGRGQGVLPKIWPKRGDRQVSPAKDIWRKIPSFFSFNWMLLSMTSIF